MKLSSNYSIKGSSILESVISITGIALCILVSFTIYLRVTGTFTTNNYYKSIGLIDEFVSGKKFATELGFQEEEAGFIINSRVLQQNEKGALLEFSINVNDRSYSVLRYVPIIKNRE